MSAALDSKFQNPHTPPQSGKNDKVRVVADENKAGQSRVYFGDGENDYLNVRGDAAETAQLADVIGKLAESERTVAKFADVQPEDRPFIICADAGKDCGGYYRADINMVALDAKKSHGYDLAGILAHELHHFEQHRRTEWMRLPVNAAEQIFVERIGESAADVAKYQYLYDVKDNPAAKEAVNDARNPFGLGGRQYFNAKKEGKSEGECVLAAMGGYASSVSNAEMYAKNYHRDLFEVQQGKIDYWVKECDPAKMEKYEKIWAEKCVSDIAHAGDKVDETAYFKQLTTGLMPELPADEKITRALRDPEFDYVPQNAYDKMKQLEPAVEKFFPNQRFLQGVNVNVNEFGRHGVCPCEEYDEYKAERDRQAAKEAAARQREETAREQLVLMREEAERPNSDWPELNGYLHNLSADVDREAAVEKSGAESALQDVAPDCLAACDDGTALRRLWQKENKAFRAQVSGLYGQFKQNEAAARDDIKNKKEIARDKNDAFKRLEKVEQNADLIRGIVDDLVMSYPAAMRTDVRAALLKGVNADEKAEMPKAKTFKDKVALFFNKRTVNQNRAAVDGVFKQIQDKAAMAAAIDPAGFDKRLSAARQEADKAFADRTDAERKPDRLKQALNAECQKLRDTMSKDFEIKAGKMLRARQTRDNAAEKANEPKSQGKPPLQSRIAANKTGLMQKLQNQTARRPDVSQTAVQRMTQTRDASR